MLPGDGHFFLLFSFYRRIDAIFEFEKITVPCKIVHVMLGVRPAPVLSERSEFTCGDRRKLLGVSGASIFCFVFVANDTTK